MTARGWVAQQCSVALQIGWPGESKLCSGCVIAKIKRAKKKQEKEEKTSLLLLISSVFLKPEISEETEPLKTGRVNNVLKYSPNESGE